MLTQGAYGGVGGRQRELPPTRFNNAGAVGLRKLSPTYGILFFAPEYHP